MIKIPDRTQIREWDNLTIHNRSIKSIELMERAAMEFVRIFSSQFPVCKVLAVCGTGNNGGDGLAILRLLSEQGYDCSAAIVGNAGKETPDFSANLETAKSLFPVKEVSTAADLNVTDATVIIDALFGSGLTRLPEGLHSAVIEKINAAGKKIISVDIPSGLLVDSHTAWQAVKASATITFQVPKLSFLLPAGLEAAGKIEIADIGLDADFGKTFSTNYFVSEAQDFGAIFGPRKINAHKGNFGHALIMAGSYGMMGAAVLSVRAALKTGAGKITAGIPGCGYQILQTSVPEAMVHTGSEEKIISGFPDLKAFSAIAFGPGAGTARETEKCLVRLLEQAIVPVVVDADGLNILAANSAYQKLLNSRTVLTPHPGEFRRLAGDWKDDFDRLRLLKQFSAETGAVVVLKGARTAVAFPDGQVFFNPTGHPLMATAGSGDVLTGIIVSLLAQGHDLKSSVLGGVFLHGKAGEIASGCVHPIIAGDIITALPAAWESLSVHIKPAGPAAV